MACEKQPAINSESTKLGSGMRYRAVWSILLLGLALCGCDQQALIRKFTVPAQDKAARIYFEDVRTGNFAPVLSALDSSFKQQMTPEVFKSMQNAFGPHPVKSITIVGARTTEQKIGGSPSRIFRSLIYEYGLGDHFVIADIVLEDAGNALQIEGIHVQSRAMSLEQTYAFTLSGKTFKFFTVFALAILIPIFVIATAVVCWRTPILRYKWLWRIFVLLGITGLTLNWTTGDLQFQLVHIDLLGAGYTQQIYGPIIFQLGFPLGAILFWIRRQKWLNQAEENAQHFN